MRNALTFVKSVANLSVGTFAELTAVDDSVDVVALSLPIRAQYLCGFSSRAPRLPAQTGASIRILATGGGRLASDEKVTLSAGILLNRQKQRLRFSRFPGPRFNLPESQSGFQFMDEQARLPRVPDGKPQTPDGVVGLALSIEQPGGGDLRFQAGAGFLVLVREFGCLRDFCLRFCHLAEFEKSFGEAVMSGDFLGNLFLFSELLDGGANQRLGIGGITGFKDVCDPCGIQLFIRREHGIRLLDKLLRASEKSELPFKQRAEELAKIQALLTEINGTKAQIERMEAQTGLFFPDNDRVRACKLLKIKLQNLFAELEQLAKLKSAI